MKRKLQLIISGSSVFAVSSLPLVAASCVRTNNTDQNSGSGDTGSSSNVPEGTKVYNE
ncbi:UNVERIFIED_CONTAM: variable surface lipoprotein [Campylobacter lari]